MSGWDILTSSLALGLRIGSARSEPRMPADVHGSGGFARLTTPIWLLYRMLLGSALANIGACASADTPPAADPVHNVAVAVTVELTIVGLIAARAGTG